MSYRPLITLTTLPIIGSAHRPALWWPPKGLSPRALGPSGRSFDSRKPFWVPPMVPETPVLRETTVSSGDYRIHYRFSKFVTK